MKMHLKYKKYTLELQENVCAVWIGGQYLFLCIKGDTYRSLSELYGPNFILSVSEEDFSEIVALHKLYHPRDSS